MKKKIILICCLFFLTNCGYNPLYSSKNSSDILINKIETAGEKKINRQILSLLSLEEVGDLENSYVLNNLVDEKIFSWAKKGSFKKIELLSKNLDYPFIDLNDIMYVSLRIYINSSSFKDEEYQNILR
jgi:hypothetical protein